MHDRRSIIALICVLPLLGWGALALYFSASLPGTLSTVAAAGFGLISLLFFLVARTWKKAMILFAVLFALVLVFFLLKKPSNNRSWQPDAALLPYATIAGDKVTLHNIRNCDYRTETDFTVHHYDKTFDLDSLTSIDLYLVDWGLGSVVHTMLSFGFDSFQDICDPYAGTIISPSAREVESMLILARKLEESLAVDTVVLSGEHGGS